jgi:hypothetical protein
MPLVKTVQQRRDSTYIISTRLANAPFSRQGARIAGISLCVDSADCCVTHSYVNERKAVDAMTRESTASKR